MRTVFACFLHAAGTSKESWSNPSLDNLANIKATSSMWAEKGSILEVLCQVASVLVSRCVFYVFFGHWLKDEEAPRRFGLFSQTA